MTTNELGLVIKPEGQPVPDYEGGEIIFGDPRNDYVALRRAIADAVSPAKKVYHSTIFRSQLHFSKRIIDAAGETHDISSEYVPYETFVVGCKHRPNEPLESVCARAGAYMKAEIERQASEGRDCVVFRVLPEIMTGVCMADSTAHSRLRFRAAFIPASATDDAEASGSVLALPTNFLGWDTVAHAAAFWAQQDHQGTTGAPLCAAVSA